MERDDYYQILGVSRYASCDAVKRAFRSRAPAVHPDRNPNEPRASENTRKLIEAYRVLADPQRRREYDQAETSHARPIVIAAQPASYFHSPSASRALTVVLAVLVVTLFAVLVAQSILAEQPRVFRPFVGAMDLSDTGGEEAMVVCLYSPDQAVSDPAPDHNHLWRVWSGQDSEILTQTRPCILTSSVDRRCALPNRSARNTVRAEHSPDLPAASVWGGTRGLSVEITWGVYGRVRIRKS
ncbi:MAG: hypothetical protein A2Z18_09485 [Armatimonadetes bacterium RBG_16_58_9]|nr:MAG: hypothetical protein A2Z18_09485 [Armatimonadetes bacterium RBG_16_58_9]